MALVLCLLHEVIGRGRLTPNISEQSVLLILVNSQEETADPGSELIPFKGDRGVSRVHISWNFLILPDHFRSYQIHELLLKS